MTAHTQKPAQRLGSPKEAADIAQCTPRTIRRWIDEGIIAGYRFGPRMIRVDLDELEDLLTPIPNKVSAA